MKLKNTAIKWMLFIYLFVFVCVMLIVLWLFQTVFLSDFYKAVKTVQIEKTANLVKKNINDYEELSSLLRQTMEHDGSISIMILSEEGSVLFSPHLKESLSITNTPLRELPLARIKVLIDTVNEVGEVSVFEASGEQAPHPPMPNIRSERFPLSGIRRAENITHISKVTNESGENVYILISALITPVEATVTTLRYQLIIVSFILVFLAVILSLLISGKFAKPIMEINEVAKQLTVGNYDITFSTTGYREINELNDTLNKAAYELSRVDSLRRELIANVSHDLRTPLTMITGFAEMIRDLPGENTPDNAQVIVDESNRLTRLVSDLLDISKIEADITDAGSDVFDMTMVLKNTSERITELLKGERRIVIEADGEVYVNAHESQIIQVIYNLIANALNYSEGDVIVKQLVNGNTVRVEVCDSGQGIADADFPHIWDRYYKASKLHVRTNIGTGLGLSIVKGVVERHKGSCGAISALGEGSVFWFELPLCEQKEV